MTASRLEPDIFDAWLAEQSADLRDVLAEIRAAIVASGHNFREGIKWGSPSYWLPEVSRRNICYIAPHTDYVRLGFFNGALMPDPDGILEGTGKKLRHVKVYKVDDTNRQTLTDYVTAATKLAIADPDSLSR